MRDVVADTDDEKQRQLQIVNEIAERVAGLQEAGTLHENDGTFAAQMQPSGDGDGFSLTANADKHQSGLGEQGRLPGPNLAVGNPNDMRDAACREGCRYGGAVDHALSPQRA